MKYWPFALLAVSLWSIYAGLAFDHRTAAQCRAFPKWTVTLTQGYCGIPDADGETIWFNDETFARWPE